MRWKPTILGGLTVVGLIAFAAAQTTPIFNWLGTETFRITLGSGSGVNIDLNTVRSTMSASPLGATTIANVSPLGGVPTFGTLLATGAITTVNVTMPNPANDGQRVCITNGTGSNFSSNTNVATVPSGGVQTQTMAVAVASASVNAGVSACWVFKLNPGSTSTGVWYRTV